MNKKVIKTLKELELFSKKHIIFNIPPEAGEYLSNLLSLHKPKKILEVGTGNGYSTLWIAGSCPDAQIITIELKESKAKEAESNFKKAALKNIKTIHGNALEILSNIHESFDFVFLDAIKKDYLKYFKIIMFNKNAIVVADNILTHSQQLQEYINYVRKNYKSELIEIGNGMEVTFL